MARKVAELNEENNELTKILILSDTHGREDYLQVMEECQADVVIHAGDFEEFSNPDYEVEDELKDQRFTHWVNGNHEVTNQMLRYNLPDDYFNKVMKKQYKTFILKGKVFLLTHFFEEEDRISKTISKRTGGITDTIEWKDWLIKKIKPNFVITGHTHRAHIDSCEWTTTDSKGNQVVYPMVVINPGSMTKPRDDMGAVGPDLPGTYVVGYANEKGEFTWQIKFFQHSYNKQ